MYISGKEKSLISSPNWSKVPHKNMDTPTRAEMTEQIKSLGKRFSEAKTDDEYDVLFEEKSRLCAQYISSASPDRKALCEKADDIISKHNEKDSSTPLGEIDIFFFMNETSEGSGKAANCSISSAYNSKGGYDYEVKAEGETVLRSTNGQWNYQLTSAELAKKDEFNRIFYTAKDNADYSSSAGLNILA